MTSTTTPQLLTDPQLRSEPEHPSPPGHPRRESAVYLGITYALAVGIALLIPGTAENPGPVSMFTLFIPAIVVGLIRLVARLRHAPANPHPLALRRGGFRYWPAAVA